MKDQRQLHELDYLTTAEAAAYCRVSLSQFKQHAPALGIQPFRFMGKVVYRKADLKSVLEESWRRSTSGASAGTSTGQTLPAGVIVTRSARYVPPMPGPLSLVTDSTS